MKRKKTRAKEGSGLLVRGGTEEGQCLSQPPVPKKDLFDSESHFFEIFDRNSIPFLF